MTLPEFKSLQERNAYLVANKSKLLRLKKATLKHCDPVNLLTTQTAAKGQTTTKGHLPQDEDGTIYRTIIGNTYNWLDSHKDVHVPGIFSKSIQETGALVVHLHDHVQALSAEVGVNLKVYEQELPWAELGVEQTGSTVSLLMDTAIKRDYDPSTYVKYLEGRIKQHSVGMQYVKVMLAVNDPEYKEEYATWLKYFDQIGNKAEAAAEGYFYAVTEAKLIEISAVIRGSNELTGIADENKAEDLLDKVREADAATLEKIADICKNRTEEDHSQEPGNHSTEPPAGTRKSVEAIYLGL